MFRLYCVLIGYAVGCIQTAYIVGRLSHRIDIREHGSRSAGTTNTVRVLGLKLGVVVFVCDILKGVLAFVLCSLLFEGSGTGLSGANGLLPGLYAGFGVILGHDFPFFLGFRGGKGVASTLGVMISADIKVALFTFAFGAAAVASTWYISVASLLMNVVYPVLLFLFGREPEEVAVCAVISVITFVQHRANIKRLVAGNENKFSFRKKGSNA